MHIYIYRERARDMPISCRTAQHRYIHLRNSSHTPNSAMISLLKPPLTLSPVLQQLSLVPSVLANSEVVSFLSVALQTPLRLILTPLLTLPSSKILVYCRCGGSTAPIGLGYPDVVAIP